MDERYAAFCERVCARVKHATPEEKQEIQKELLDHLEEHTQALVDIGRGEDEARSAAVAAMGNPEEIGRELNREFPLVWLLLSRIPAFITGILVLLLIVPFLNQCRQTYENLYARLSPAPGYNNNEYVEHLIDIRMEVPECHDVIRFFSADVIKRGEDYYAYIGSCCYDKSIFGLASYDALNGVDYETVAPSRFSGSTGYISSGRTGQLREIQIAYGTESVTATYDRYGTYWQVEIPLNWEDVT